jgi:hypothetical protein
MADNATQIMYRQEFIKKFEERQSLLLKTVTTEADIKALSAVFLTAGSGAEEAVTRGSSGLIPAIPDDETQVTATLKEWHALKKKTGFNIYTGQSDQRKIMQMNALAILNRKIDKIIITELMTGTQYAGVAAETASLALVMKAKGILGNADVEYDGNLNCLITPAFEAYLMQTKEFASADYVNNKPFETVQRMFTWAGVNFIVHRGLTGKGTAAEYCIMYHKDAIGHAMDKAAIVTDAGYNGEQDYSWFRATGFMGSKLLQNTGVVQIRHDGSAFAATA